MQSVDIIIRLQQFSSIFAGGGKELIITFYWIMKQQNVRGKELRVIPKICWI
jgi:hypothetical protein